ncbi:hypothetical protein HDU93_008787 [Gonapodya sp. JEL0774]|nr:hypothetical protein HDU93_008787 [Gonapodya sp. JEL0774]
MTPLRLDGSIHNLEVFGEIPKSLNGTFFRASPDPSQPPKMLDNPLFAFNIDGDGHISAFTIKDGHVDWTGRYVRTDRFLVDRAARETLFGIYRNPFSRHPTAKDVDESTANTNAFFHAGKLLALKENGQAYELDPVTLETKGKNPFNLRSKTFTAHPKVDATTGVLVGFGYESAGFMTKDVSYFEIGPDGKVLIELSFDWPFVAFSHDCALTKNYFIIYNWSFEANLEQMQAGGPHWTFDGSRPVNFAVIPRGCKDPSQIKIFKGRPGQPGHTAGAWESEDGKIQVETTMLRGSSFLMFPSRNLDENSNEQPKIPGLSNNVVRWTIDPSTENLSALAEPENILDAVCEVPRIDERSIGTGLGKFNRIWISANVGSFAGLAFNTLIQADKDTGVQRRFEPGSLASVQECVFIPRSPDSPEGDGYVMVLVVREDNASTELTIIDTNNFETPIAVARLPFMMPTGIHGNWVDASRIPGHI